MIQAYWNLLRIFETTFTTNRASLLYTLRVTHSDLLRSFIKILHMRLSLTLHFARMTPLWFLLIDQLTCILFSSAAHIILFFTTLILSNHDLLFSVTYLIVLLIEINSLVLRLVELNVANISMDGRLLGTGRIATHWLRLEALLLAAFFIGIHNMQLLLWLLTAVSFVWPNPSFSLIQNILRGKVCFSLPPNLIFLRVLGVKIRLRILQRWLNLFATSPQMISSQHLLTQSLYKLITSMRWIQINLSTTFKIGGVLVVICILDRLLLGKSFWRGRNCRQNAIRFSFCRLLFNIFLHLELFKSFQTFRTLLCLVLLGVHIVLTRLMWSRIRSHLLLSDLLMRCLLEAVIIHVDSKKFSLPICVYHQLDSGHLRPLNLVIDRHLLLFAVINNFLLTRMIRLIILRWGPILVIVLPIWDVISANVNPIRPFILLYFVLIWPQRLLICLKWRFTGSFEDGLLTVKGGWRRLRTQSMLVVLLWILDQRLVRISQFFLQNSLFSVQSLLKNSALCCGCTIWGILRRRIPLIWIDFLCHVEIGLTLIRIRTSLARVVLRILVGNFNSLKGIVLWIWRSINLQTFCWQSLLATFLDYRLFACTFHIFVQRRSMIGSLRQYYLVRRNRLYFIGSVWSSNKFLALIFGFVKNWTSLKTMFLNILSVNFARARTRRLSDTRNSGLVSGWRRMDSSFKISLVRGRFCRHV